MNQSIAILLCAGYGTRMGDLTTDRPKPLLPLAGRPMLDYLLDRLFELPALGEIHVVSNHHYLDAFRAWERDWSGRLPAGQRLIVHDDGSRHSGDRLGAVGDLAFVLESIPEERWAQGALVAAGDNILQFSLQPLWERFRASGDHQLLALHEGSLERLRRTGVLELDAESRVVALHEKPEDPPSTWACPSLYCLASSALERVAGYLAADHPRDEIGRFIGYLVKREAVFAVPTHGERLHVGSPEAYQHAESILAGE